MSYFDRRQALRLLAALGATGSMGPVLSACGGDSSTNGSDQANRETLTIGVVVPQSGTNSSLGDEILNGFQLYLKENDSVLGGHSIRLNIVDEGETIDTAKTAVAGLIEQRVRLLVGISNAEALSAVKDSVEAGQIPLLTPSPSLSGLQSASYIWRTGFITDEPGKALAQWIANNSHGSVFVLASESDGVKDDVRGFIETLTAANGTVYQEPVYSTPGTRDFTTRLTQLKATSVGALLCMYTGAAGVEVVKLLKEAGLPSSLKIFGPGMLTEGEQLTQLGESAAGIYTAMNYSYDLSTESNYRFVASYQDSYKTSPSAMAVAAYDAAAAIDKALVLAGDDDSALGINNAIGQLGQIESPRGTWQFNQTRSPLQKWFLRQVQSDGPVLANVLTAELVTLG